MLIRCRTWRTRVRAAVQARAVVPGGSDIVIIARTDALAVEGFDAAINRVRDPRLRFWLS
jgi:2-methylisocitrate lyase-like PEP mutase family enzyme